MPPGFAFRSIVPPEHEIVEIEDAEITEIAEMAIELSPQPAAEQTAAALPTVGAVGVGLSPRAGRTALAPLCV